VFSIGKNFQGSIDYFFGTRKLARLELCLNKFLVPFEYLAE
jgi:hypothetical protein